MVLSYLFRCLDVPSSPDWRLIEDAAGFSVMSKEQIHHQFMLMYYISPSIRLENDGRSGQILGIFLTWKALQRETFVVTA